MKDFDSWNKLKKKIEAEKIILTNFQKREKFGCVVLEEISDLNKMEVGIIFLVLF